ncbi:MAG: hypothetical protein LC808_20210 [Actinobacteria bacterium]|nr:hypothetical protein [Actinomycetota bacterium]
MALIYRAIWRDEGNDLIASAASEAERWLRDTKGIQVDALPEDELRGDLRYDRFGPDSVGPFELTTRRAETDGMRALQLRLHEQALGEQRNGKWR